MSRIIFAIAISSVLIAVTGCGDTGLIVNGSAGQNQSNSSGELTVFRINGLYHGYSDVSAGRIHWLLQLDSQTGDGRLYLPPQILVVHHFSINPSGAVALELEDEGNVVGRFDGYSRTSGITGEFKYKDGREFKTQLTKINERLIEAESSVLAGLYSNVRYVAEGGDLIGAELLLIPEQDHLGGSLTLYEGVPGNIYALDGQKLANGSVRFTIRTHNGPRTFIGQVSDDVITISDEKSPNETFLLPKRRSLRDCFLRNSTVPDVQ